MNDEILLMEQSFMEVQWVPRDHIVPNDYNPNVMDDEVKRLLQVSMLEDGFSLPLVVIDPTQRTDVSEEDPYELIDGEQRWDCVARPLESSLIGEVLAQMLRRKASGQDVNDTIINWLKNAFDRIKSIEAEGRHGTYLDLTGGMLPIIRVPTANHVQRMLSTIRLNRSRGTHSVAEMGRIVKQLHSDEDFSLNELELRLGMPADDLNDLLSLGTDFDTDEWVFDPDEFENPAFSEMIKDQLQSEAIVSAKEAAQRESEAKKKAAQKIAVLEQNRGLLTQEEKEIIENDTIAEFTAEFVAFEYQPLSRLEFFFTGQQGMVVRTVLEHYAQKMPLVRGFIAFMEKVAAMPESIINE